MDYTEKLLQEEVVWKGSFLSVRNDQVILPTGNVATREWVVHPGAVTILAITNDDKVVLVNQFRYPIEQHTWELPAGKLAENEDPMDCAKRELMEETGYQAKDWQMISKFYTTPGFSNEIMYLFIAKNLEPGESSPDEDEFVHCYEFSWDKLNQMLKNQEIIDSKTIIGLLLYKCGVISHD